LWQVERLCVSSKQCPDCIFLSDLDEPGTINASEIAALVGVAPINRDSGVWRGQRKIRGGRKPVRNALYMAAVAAARTTSNPFGRFYSRLIERGKPAKIALTAVMRKMAIAANTLIKENREWTPIMH
jgi:transposase